MATKKETKKVTGLTVTTINGNKRTFVKLNGGDRHYELPNGRVLEVYNAVYFNSDEGNHRIICSDGQCVYIDPAAGWFVTWMNFSALDENYIF